MGLKLKKRYEKQRSLEKSINHHELLSAMGQPQTLNLKLTRI